MTALTTTLALAALLAAGPASAQMTRSWVSGTGDDSQPCSRTAPCKTFAGALAKTSAGGEINALDAGGFGSVTITKSITLDGTGALASILGASGVGIVVDLGAEDKARSVRLRGLTINGAGGGAAGIKVVSPAKVSIEDSVVDGFADGISVAEPAARVFVSRTTVRNNRGSGIAVSAGTAALSRCVVIHNGTGLSAAGGTILSFKDNVLFGNGTDGEPTASASPR